MKESSQQPHMADEIYAGRKIIRLADVGVDLSVQIFQWGWRGCFGVTDYVQFDGICLL